MNSQEQKRLLMDLDVNMRTVDCFYTVTFYGALFREVGFGQHWSEGWVGSSGYLFSPSEVLAYPPASTSGLLRAWSLKQDHLTVLYHSSVSLSAPCHISHKKENLAWK